jgi:protein O-GlcNAc transferase
MPLTASYPACPLCGGNDRLPVGTFDCTSHALYVPPLPGTLTWVRCAVCGHVHTDRYWTAEGLKVLFAKANPSQLAGSEFEEKRYWWAPVVRNVLACLGTDAARDELGIWLDAGCGDGSLVMTAAEFGFDAIGLDSRIQAVERIASLGYRAVRADFLHSALERPVAVVSMADVLEHVPYPVEALRKAHAMLRADGALFVSCPNMDCAPWRAMDAARTNPYWMEIEHHHNFTRNRLMRLLEQCGFRPVSYDISPRYKAGMEIISRKAEAS